MKIKGVSPIKIKQREHVSRLNKTNHYYTKTMTSIKNNNAQSFGNQQKPDSRHNYHQVNQSTMGNKTNYSRYKDQSNKVSTTKNSSSQMSSPVAIRNATKKQSSPAKESSTKVIQEKAVNSSNLDNVYNKRFASLNPRDGIAIAIGGGFKGISNLNTTEQSKKNIRESRDVSN